VPPKKAQFSRKEGTRTPKDAGEVYLHFSFRFLREEEPPKNPQSLASWEAENLSSPLLNSLRHLSTVPLPKLIDQQIIKIYGKYPPKDKCDFKEPENIPSGAHWASLRKIAGQKGRVAGFILNQIFYVVFLDKDHQFWKSELKNT